MDVDPIAILNPHVAVLAVFFDGQKDLMQDYRLGRQSLEALLRILPSKKHARLTGAHWSRKDYSPSPGGFFLLGDGGYPCIEGPVAIITPYREPLQGGAEPLQPASCQGSLHHRAGLWHDENQVEIAVLQGSGGPPHLCPLTHQRLCSPAQHLPHSGGILEPAEDVGDTGVVPPSLVRGEQGGHGQRDRLAGLLSAPRGGLREVDGSSSSVVVLLLVPGCPGSSSSSIAWPQGAAPAPLDEEPIPLGATSAESIRTGGSMEGRLPMASCIRENHDHVAAVASPASVPVPVGGVFSSWGRTRNLGGSEQLLQPHLLQNLSVEVEQNKAGDGRAWQLGKERGSEQRKEGKGVEELEERRGVEQAEERRAEQPEEDRGAGQPEESRAEQPEEDRGAGQFERGQRSRAV
ncbi:hypothetical protein F7725_025784 [Dissostichus mawsoni]|uniref:DDE Tnp4 domain-containing protein n=1 Tax=Dissostichus mawsoni TaxID=36200 RepID=A0A7J5X620_DISMA|nr:hypothetical protein F7725_025784 [Dissostichus mawsoni]